MGQIAVTPCPATTRIQSDFIYYLWPERHGIIYVNYLNGGTAGNS